MKITITAREAIDKGIWLKLTEIKGINPWAYNEGMLSDDTGIELTEEEVKQLGLVS